MTEVLDALADDAVALVDGRRRAVLGIAGRPGAGKSTLVWELAGRVARRCGPNWVAHVPMDGFHLSNNKLAECGLLGVKGAPETFDVNGFVRAVERMRADPAATILAGIRPLDRATVPGAIAIRPSAKLVVVEGTTSSSNDRLARPAQVLRRDLVRRRATAVLRRLLKRAAVG
jgi:pantothenate kinase